MDANMQKASAEIPILKSDPYFAEEVMAGPGGDTLSLCYQCGLCTGCCPVSAIDDAFSPALIIQWIRLGLREAVLSSPKIWLCLRCHRCSFLCPQGVRFADINATVANLAIRDGYMSRVKADRLAALESRLGALRRLVIEKALDLPETDPVNVDAFIQDAMRDLHG